MEMPNVSGYRRVFAFGTPSCWPVLKEITMHSRALKPDSVQCRPINQKPIRAEMALPVGAPVSG